MPVVAPKSDKDVQVECHVIKSQLSYDSILASLRPKGSTETDAVVQDEIKSVYVPELNQHADVVFTRGQMYIAQGFAQQRIWHPVQREALSAEHMPYPPKPAAYALTDSQFRSPSPPNSQTPPPPYQQNAETVTFNGPTPGQLTTQAP